MRWCYVWILFLAAPLHVFAQKSQKASTLNVYNEQGGIQMTIHYSPVCDCKTYTEFFGDGKILAKRTFKVDGKKEYVDGEEAEYYKDGKVKFSKQWKNAVPEGRAYYNHENGKLLREEFYQDKCKSGTWRTFDKDGFLIKEQVFVEGKTPWDSKADHCTTKLYVNNKLTATETIVAGKKGKMAVNDSAYYNRMMASSNIDGAAIFKLKCSVCHAPDKDGYGPALKGVYTKRKEGWLRNMIVNGQALVEGGDKDAIALSQKYRGLKHPNFQKLSKEQVDAVVGYLKGMK